MKRSVATWEPLLVFPATLFMASLFLRQIQPPQYQPAHAATLLVTLAALAAACILAIVAVHVFTD